MPTEIMTYLAALAANDQIMETCGPLKLHLGCGSQKIYGCVNIDCRKTSATDLVCDIRKLPHNDNTVASIESYHLIEHIPVSLMPNIEPHQGAKYGSLISLLKEWYRVLEPGGKLVIEAPDFDRIIEEYIKGDNDRKEEMIVYIYGGFRANSIHDLHRWGVSEYRLTYILERAGFREITFQDAQDYHIKICPCIRVEAIK